MEGVPDPHVSLEIEDIQLKCANDWEQEDLEWVGLRILEELEIQEADTGSGKVDEAYINVTVVECATEIEGSTDEDKEAFIASPDPKKKYSEGNQSCELPSGNLSGVYTVESDHESGNEINDAADIGDAGENTEVHFSKPLDRENMVSFFTVKVHEDEKESAMQLSSNPRAVSRSARKTSSNIGGLVSGAGSSNDVRFSSATRHLLPENGDDDSDSMESIKTGMADGPTRNKVAFTYQQALKRMKAAHDIEFMDGNTSKHAWKTILLSMKRMREFLDGLSLWGNRIQAVEGIHGSNVALVLYFLRWTLLLNIALMFLWVGMAVFPFIVHPPPHFSWRIFTESSMSQLLQGYGLDRTWLLYGGYNYAQGVQFGGWYWYQPEIAFPVATAGMYAVSFCSVLYVIAQRVSGSGHASTVEQNQIYPFSSVVFASWDFHLRNKSAARSLQSAIRKQIIEMLHDLSWEQKTLTISQKLTKGMTKIVGTMILWPVTIILAAAALYYVIDKGEYINSYFGSGYSQSIIITLVAIISEFAVRCTVKYEGWHPRMIHQVEAVKLFSVKAIHLGVMLNQLYSIQKHASAASSNLSEDLTSSLSSLDSCDSSNLDRSCEIGFHCCHDGCTKTLGSPILKDYCVPVCEENIMGLIFYRLILTNGVIISLQEVAMAYFMYHCLKKPLEMDGAKFFVKIIETQAFVWLGTATAPLLPAFGVLSNMTTFYLKTWMAQKFYKPPNTTCSASRNSTLLYTLMLSRQL